MAIFLVMDRDKVNLSDSVKSERGCYKLGDIVEVFDDDKPCVIPPAEPFYIIKISGLSKADALKFIEPVMDETFTDAPVMVKRRKYQVPIDDLPVKVKEALKDKRYIEIEWKTVREYVIDKVTLASQ